MANEALRIEGMQELLKLVTSLGGLKAAGEGVKLGAIYLKGKVAVYPAQQRPTRASVYGSSFKSDKQRRYFFWALKKGEIEVPYRRGESPSSETFGRRWTVQFESDGLRAIVGNNASYGPLLMDEEQQSLYAKAAGWRTVQAIMAEERETVTELVQSKIRELIARQAG